MSDDVIWRKLFIIPAKIMWILKEWIEICAIVVHSRFMAIWGNISLSCRTVLFLATCRGEWGRWTVFNGASNDDAENKKAREQSRRSHAFKFL